LTGPVVTNLERVFMQDLVTSGRSVAVPQPVQDPDILVASTLPRPDIRPLALELLDSARTSLDLEQFVITDTGVVHALEHAHSRGVNIHLLLDPSQAPSDAPADDLRGSGVDVRLYPTHGELLHAKAAVADGERVLFGSANWTTSGFEHNHEVDVEIFSPTVAHVFTQQMSRDWNRGVT
ncbi:MAG TPA: phospholipase D family protein, partial [Candidatus Sulfotelmatobacter sp.]|nr:phospholipase D family protein [Candidatus Sulfotelmatobacter sp.]